jgi:hypothetical protein
MGLISGWLIGFIPPLQKCGTTPRDEPLLQQHWIFEAEAKELGERKGIFRLR